LEGYSEVLNLEVRAFGICVSLIEPAFTRTGFIEQREEIGAPLEAYRDARARVSPVLKERTQTGSDPDQVAQVILKAVTAPNPAARYTCDLDGAILQGLRALL